MRSCTCVAADQRRADSQHIVDRVQILRGEAGDYLVIGDESLGTRSVMRKRVSSAYMSACLRVVIGIDTPAVAGLL